MSKNEKGGKKEITPSHGINNSKDTDNEFVIIRKPPIIDEGKLKLSKLNTDNCKFDKE